MTTHRVSDRFVSLTLVGMDMPVPGVSVYTYECQCGQCHGVRLHMSKFQVFFLQPCPVVLGDFDAMCLINFDPDTCGGNLNHGGGLPRDTITAVCVQTLTDKE
jgi:hypothetical protein